MSEKVSASKRLRDKRRALGLCVKCSEPSPDKSNCPTCRAHDEKGRRTRVAARKAKGLCVSCGGPKPCSCQKGAARRHRAKKLSESGHSKWVPGLPRRRPPPRLCLECGETLPCEHMEVIRRERVKLKHRAISAARKAAGLCTQCARVKPCHCQTLKLLKSSPPRPKPDKCELCRARPARCLDHDHVTGSFRGWLCGGCNILCQDLKVLQRALDWVTRGGI